MITNSAPLHVLKYQGWHFLMLSILLLGLSVIIQNTASILSGQLFGMQSSTWFIIAVLSPILHQVYVWVCWRSELLYQSITNALGKNGFRFYKVGFGILFSSRLITIFLLAFSSAHTLELSRSVLIILLIPLVVLSGYLFFSVIKYFGIDRAYGIDHFQPNLFKGKPLVRHGIFKYTSNGMYIFGFLILYIPGLLLLSKAALLVALFNHLYIWVHYYFTELPDLKYIYGD